MMDKGSTQYRVTSTRECIDYIEKSGLTIQDDSEYKIKSTSGLVYVLPNSEVALIPTNFDLDYPGIIFANLETFKHYADLNFFPIGDNNMSWSERHNNQVKNFRTQSEFYKNVLTKTLHTLYPFRNAEDIESSFLKIQEIIGSSNRRNFTSEQVSIIFSFGLGVINYLIDKNGYELLLQEGYENYNPITRVLVKKDGEIKDLLYMCLIYFDGFNPNALKNFMHYVEIPTT